MLPATSLTFAGLSEPVTKSISSAKLLVNAQSIG